MEYMSTKDAEKKWNISERRIRQLLQDGRIDGAIKVGSTWNIPINANKPIDKRNIKLNDNKLKFTINNNLLYQCEKLNKKINAKRPIPKMKLERIRESINLEWIYNSNGIEGNTLTLRETQVVLEGITVGGKSMKEHLEVINHEQAILYLDELVKNKEQVTEWNIKSIHQLILKEIDNENAGVYRREPVTIKGAIHIPPDYLIVPDLMEKLILNYKEWEQYHPIVRAALLHGELVKIHPFVDGNGRTSRLVMNLSLMSNGYLPVIIKKDKRLDYYNALDKAHTTGDYTDFVNLVLELEIEMLNRYMELLFDEIEPLDFTKDIDILDIYQHICYYHNEINKYLNTLEYDKEQASLKLKKIYNYLKKEYEKYSEENSSINKNYHQYIINIKETYKKITDIILCDDLPSNLDDIQDYMKNGFENIFNITNNNQFIKERIDDYLGKKCCIKLKNNNIYVGRVDIYLFDFTNEPIENISITIFFLNTWKQIYLNNIDTINII